MHRSLSGDAVKYMYIYSRSTCMFLEGIIIIVSDQRQNYLVLNICFCMVNLAASFVFTTAMKQRNCMLLLVSMVTGYGKSIIFLVSYATILSRL